MKKADIVTSLILIPVDGAMLLGAGLTSYALRYHPLVTQIRPVFFEYPLDEFFPALLLVSSLAIFIFALNGSYAIRSTLRYPELVSKVFQGISTTILVLIVLIFLRRELFSSRFIIIFAWATACLFVIIGRIIVFKIKQLLFSRGFALHSLVVLSDSEEPAPLTAYITQRPQLGYRIVAVKRNDDEKFRTLIKNTGTEARIDEILDLRSDIPADKRKELINVCHELNLSYRYAPSLHQGSLKNYEVDDIGGTPIIHVKKTPLDGWGRVLKRTADLFFSFTGIIVLFPIGIIIAAFIALDSRGPIIVALPRIGRGGKTFLLYKFRSMVKNARDLKQGLTALNERSGGPLFKLRNDPRITRVGRLLRRTSLDELPQPWNVLRGEMSLVGPRPHEPEEVGSYEDRFKTLVAIKPGITGLARVSGRAQLPFNKEAVLDLYYIEHWSVWLDTQIIARTLIVLFKFSQAF